MDPELTDDKALEADRRPAAHAVEAAGEGAAKAGAGLLGVALLALFVIFVLLAVAGVFFFRPV